MSLTESFQVEDAASLRRRGKRDDGNNQKSDDDNDNNDNNDNNRSSTQTSTLARSGPPTTLASSTSALVATTTLLPSQKSTALPVLISAIPEIPSTFTSTSSLPSAAIPATSTPSTPSSSTPSRTTTVVLAVVAAGAGASIIILLLFCIYKPLSRRPKPTPAFARPQRVQSQDTSSRFWGSSQSGSTTVEEIPPSVPAMAYNMANSAVDRHERLGLVRNSLLRPQERDELLIRSQSQTRKWQDETLVEGRSNEDGAQGPNNHWEGMRMSERVRVDIEASGRWEAPVTIAARDSRIESVVSVPRWRDPITWVRDQVERDRKREDRY